MLSAFKLRSRGTRGDAGRDRSATTSLRVLVSDRAPSHRVSYVDQLVGDDSAGEAPGAVDFQFRGNPHGVFDVDVIHLTSTRAVTGDGRISEREQIRRATRFVKALKRKRIALVRLLDPAEASAGGQPTEAVAILDAATARFVSMNSPESPARDAEVIGHSHLRHRFLGYPHASIRPGRLLLISADPLTESFEGPLKVFSIADLPDNSLRIVGPLPTAIAHSFKRTIARDPSRISLRRESISDAARVEEITAAELVIVPSPDARNSLAIIMLALSLDRPVLVQKTAATTALADEVGHDWVRLHDGPLTAVVLEDAVARFQSDPPSGAPNLDARDPNTVAARYLAVYRAAAASR